MVHDRDPLREAGHDLHVVLDHQHRLALVAVHCADQLDELRHVLDATPAIGSSSSSTRGVAGEQHGELELALVAVREQPGEHAPRAAEPDAAERPARPLDARSRTPFARRQIAHRAAEGGLRGEPRRSRARAGAGRRSRPGTSARARPRATERRLAVISTPSSSTLPLVGRSTPEIRLNSVVLPAPFGPITASISPRATSSPTPARMVAPPMSSPRSLVARIGDALTVGVSASPASPRPAAPSGDGVAVPRIVGTSRARSCTSLTRNIGWSIAWSCGRIAWTPFGARNL